MSGYSVAVRRVDMGVVIDFGGITKDVRKYAAEQGTAEEEALERGMQEKIREFTEKGSELYAKV